MGKADGTSEYARPDSQVHITEVGGPAEEAAAPPGISPGRPRTGPNPYFLAAWVLTAAMTAAGIFLILLIRHQLFNPPAFANLGESYSSGTVLMDPATGAFQSPAFFMPTQEVSALAPQLVIAGLIGATLLLIVQGVMHRMLRSPAAPD